MPIDLRQLRGFVAVAEELHFGRAASRLSMTQPPLSQQIRQLEDELGVQLFERTKRSVALTAIGRELLAQTRGVLAGADGLKPLAQSWLRGDAGDLSLGFVSTADYGLLPPLLRAFTRQYPKVRLQLREATTDIQLDALQAGHLDVGLLIGPLPPPAYAAGGSRVARLAYRPLVREPLVLALPEEQADAFGDGPIAFDAIADLPLIIFPRRLAPAFYDIITGCYDTAGRVPEVVQEAIQMQTIVSLVSAGMGIALVPRSLRHLQRTGVVYRSLLHAPSVESGLAWRVDHAGPVLQRFIEVAAGVSESAD
jgi:DNA-binding transcriptional LysR family regulator